MLQTGTAEGRLGAAAARRERRNQDSDGLGYARPGTNGVHGHRLLDLYENFLNFFL